MSPDRLLEAARSRLSWQRALRNGETTAVWVLAGALAGQLGSLVFPYSLRWEWALVAAAGSAVAVTLLVRFVRPATRLEAACWLDRRCALLDRMCTYVAVREGNPRSALVNRFLEDVHRAVQQVHVSRAVPIRPVRWRAVLALVASVVVWDLVLSGATLPNTPARRVAEAVRREGRRLLDLAQEWERDARSRGLVEASRSARRARQAAELMSAPRATLSMAQRQLRGLREEIVSVRAAVQSRMQEAGSLADRDGLKAAQALRELERELARVGRALEEVPLGAEQAEQLRRTLSLLEGKLHLQRSAPASAALREAQRRLERRDRPGAREAVRRAEDTLRELVRLMEEEGALAKQQHEVEASSLSIAQAVRGGVDPEAAQARPVRYPDSPRNRPGGAGGQDDPEAQVWEGPQEGAEPGWGHVPDKLGSATPRLDARRRQEHLPGEVGEGKVFAARVQAPGVADSARTPLLRVPARVVRQADEALRAARVPAPYREWVRRYFSQLTEAGP